MKKFLLVVASMLVLGQPLHAEQKEVAPLKSTLTMEELKAGEFTSAYGKRQYFKDIPEYVNTQCSTKTYTYKTPYFQFEVQEGFSIKYYTKKGGYSYDYAVIVMPLNNAEEAPDDCSNRCIAKYYETRMFMSAYLWKNGKYTELPWPLEKQTADGKQAWPGTQESWRERHSRNKELGRHVINCPDKTQIIVRWHLFSFIETALRKRDVEVLLPNGMALFFGPRSGSSHEVAKREDCFLDTVIKTIRPR